MYFWSASFETAMSHRAVAERLLRDAFFLHECSVEPEDLNPIVRTIADGDTNGRAHDPMVGSGFDHIGSTSNIGASPSATEADAVVSNIDWPMASTMRTARKAAPIRRFFLCFKLFILSSLRPDPVGALRMRASIRHRPGTCHAKEDATILTLADKPFNSQARTSRRRFSRSMSVSSSGSCWCSF